MRKLALAGLLAMAAPIAMAQTGGPPPAGSGAAGTQPAAAGQAEAGGPANLCQELVAFMQAPSPGEAPAAGVAAPAAQGAAPSSGGPASGQAIPPKPTDQTESAQQLSGQSGVAVNAPAPNSAPVAGTGSAEAAPQRSSRSAPVPNTSAGTPKDSVMSVQDAEALAAANDMPACRDAAQKLRRAGVVMPPPLLALAALDLRFFKAQSR